MSNALAIATVTETLFHVLTALLGQTSVVREHLIFTQNRAKLVREPLRQAPGIAENQRGSPRFDGLCNAVQDLRNVLGGRHRFELALG